MYSKYQLGIKYLKYWLGADNGKGHGIHSPFVFDFVTKVLNDHRNFYCYDTIERLRDSLLKDDSLLTIQDFGAGSRVDSRVERSVASIARTALKPSKYSQLMFRMVNFYKPQTILELGTSLGITSSYLASGNAEANVTTMEGAESIAKVALNNFDRLGLKNISLVQGNFDVTLFPTLAGLPEIDFAFIDGNHRYEPTANYFNQIIAKANTSSIIILDDIHWSSEMEQAWKYAQDHESVTATIDLFFIGVVLLRKEFMTKQHFMIRY